MLGFPMDEAGGYLDHRKGRQLHDAVRRSSLGFRDGKKQRVLDDIADLAGEGNGLKVGVELAE
jgi:hypothetical protein